MGRPPHKRYELFLAEYRFGMARLTVQGKPGFTTSRIEIDREG